MYQPDDFARLVKFIAEARKPDKLSQYPSFTDFEEMMASMDIETHTRLWFDDSERLVGYSLVDNRNNNIWFEVDPKLDTSQLDEKMLVWGIQRFKDWKTNRAVEVDATLDTNCDEDELARIALLKAHGFIPQDLMTLHLERSLTEPIPPVEFPSGYAIRPVAGECEVDDVLALYHAAYGTDRMTREELLSIMRTSTYERELDLVAISVNGHIIGLCTCGMDVSLNQKLPRKEGWTDPILVHPDHQKLGLSCALIHRGWQLLKSRGIEVAVLGTSSQNAKGVAAFTNAGYHITYRKPWFSLSV